MKVIQLVLITCCWLVYSTVEGFNLKKFIYRRGVQFLESPECSADFGGNYAIIVPGWRENCNNRWVLDLRKNLRHHRGGCITCMEYSAFASVLDYVVMVRHIHDIGEVLAEKFVEMENRGFDADSAYVFGFSLGARIALEAGRMYGPQRIAEIDICDMAGIGFDKFWQPDPKLSAQNVQCIHTSRDKGTRSRNCHQDWNMGYCGTRQEGASDPPYGSHGLCPYFYNSAFENDFIAESWPRQCPAAGFSKRSWPYDFKMGYMEKRKFEVTGIFYASTTEQYPFTLNDNRRTTLRVYDIVYI